jgi:hypothetical protein
MNGGKPADTKRNAAVLALLDTGMTQQAVADRLGITKNTVAGIWARAGRGIPKDGAWSTMGQRLDALHARMDAVRAETVGVGRMPNKPRENAPTKPFGLRYGH